MMVTGIEKVVLIKYILNVIFWMRFKVLFFICFSYSNVLFKVYFFYFSKDVNIKIFYLLIVLKINFVFEFI